VKLLVDTSVWVDYLRAGDRALVEELDGYLDRESVLMCGPVIAELLAGTRPEDRETLWLALGNLPWADLDQVSWRQAGELANDLRRAGVSVSLTDVTIAVASVNADAELWSRDADFARIRDAWSALTLKA
jgi:predicted nucleic acid-binding protein